MHSRIQRTEPEKLRYARILADNAIKKGSHLPWEIAWQRAQSDAMLPEEISMRSLHKQSAEIDKLSRTMANKSDALDTQIRDAQSERAKAYAMAKINRGQPCSFEEALEATR
ncbi:MAG: hypothetical protein K8T91_20120 [Planctomycetes bacterium]|nr:hypothetical protein [Planctomycetota bacterium]